MKNLKETKNNNKKMKSIYEKFTDEEFAELQEVKKKRSWHDFIMLLKNWIDEDSEKSNKEVEQ